MRSSSPRLILCLRANAGLLLIILLLAQAVRAEDPKKLHYTGYVNDFAGVLSADAKARLTTLCTEVDQKADAQIAVVSVRSLEGEPIEQFSIDLATHWGVGPKQKDRGVLILLAPNDRKYRVEVGYGLEGILPDGKVGGFGREMVPLLRQGDYNDALLLLTSRIAQVIAQDRGVTLTVPLAPPGAAPRRGQPYVVNWTPFALFFFFFVVFPLLISLLRLLFGVVPGPQRRGGGWGVGGPWISGGSSGGWGGDGGTSGGGFGGFGGGSFGGGGASGSW